MALLRELMQQAKCTPRMMAKLRGKCGLQVRCIDGVAPFLVPFNHTVKEIPLALRRTMGVLFEWLPFQQVNLKG
jgi:hypothetical protein